MLTSPSEENVMVSAGPQSIAAGVPAPDEAGALAAPPADEEATLLLEAPPADEDAALLLAPPTAEDDGAALGD